MTQKTTGVETLAGRHVLQWHITHRCNLRCRHCYQEDFRSEMGREELLDVLDKYERFLKERSLAGHINLTGGEPLASPYFPELAGEIVRRGMTFSIAASKTSRGSLPVFSLIMSKAS